jgi:UDP-N-acetylmuramate dehydrogenase
MQIQENVSLKPYNTFGIDAKARWFAEFANVEQLNELIQHSTFNPPSPAKAGYGRAGIQHFVLGGGSNILFTGDINGIVLKNEVSGIEKISEDQDHVFIKTGAGENWHRFVLHCIENNWAGVENLSLIPGNVGASPMQNIGAYGVELKSVFHELEAFHLQEKTNYVFGLKDCEFDYRQSVFKERYRNQFVIMNVTFRLNKRPVFNTSYGAVEKELEKMGVKELNIAAISQAVINIRSSKLPDPAVIGNAGSFFKNPIVTRRVFEDLQKNHPGIIGFDNNDGNMKLAAAWLIEQCGWKGYRKGDAGCHANQALVLVNYGNASGAEIFDLSEQILQSVKAKFGVVLEREVNIVSRET